MPDKHRSRRRGRGPTTLAQLFGAQAVEAVADAQLQLDEHSVKLTSLDKLYWPDEGYTKRDLLEYYATIATTILPYLKQRPLILKRYPNGIDGHSFFQHHVEDPPGFLHTEPIEVDGSPVHYAVCNNLAALLYITNLGTIGANPWHSRVGQLDRPDWIVFDLDPGEVEFEAICALALTLAEVLDELELTGYPKTSGARGIHIYVPIKPLPYAEAASFAEQFAQLVHARSPQLSTLERALNKRPARSIYLDHMQNAEGKSVVAPYAVRPRPGATVSAPLSWDEVRACPRPTDFTIKTMPARLQQQGDLFAPLLSQRHDLQAAGTRLQRLLKRSR